MLSSRISLSLAAYGFCQLVSLACFYGHGAGAMASVNDTAISVLFPWFAASAFCVLGWTFTFFRDVGSQYVFPSRIILSFFAAILAVFSTLILIDLGIYRGLNLNTLQDWEFAAYVAVLAILALSWFAIYFRTRGLYKASQSR